MTTVRHWTPAKFANGITTGTSHDSSLVEANFGQGARMIRELSVFRRSDCGTVDSVLAQRERKRSDYSGMTLEISTGRSVGLQYVQDTPEKPLQVVAAKPLPDLGVVVAIPEAKTVEA